MLVLQEAPALFPSVCICIVITERLCYFMCHIYMNIQWNTTTARRRLIIVHYWNCLNNQHTTQQFLFPCLFGVSQAAFAFHLTESHCCPANTAVVYPITSHEEWGKEGLLLIGPNAFYRHFTRKVPLLNHCSLSLCTSFWFANKTYPMPINELLKVLNNLHTAYT